MLDSSPSNIPLSWYRLLDYVSYSSSHILVMITRILGGMHLTNSLMLLYILVRVEMLIVLLHLLMMLLLFFFTNTWKIDWLLQ